MPTISDRLREVREALSLSQQLMAERCGIAARSQRNYESGERLPDAAYLSAAAAVGADILYIVTGQRSQPVNATAVLPPDERLLVDNYRSCTPEAKRNLIQTSALLSAGLGGGGVARAPGKRVTQTIHANASVGGSVVAGDVVVGGKARKR